MWRKINFSIQYILFIIHFWLFIEKRTIVQSQLPILYQNPPLTSKLMDKDFFLHRLNQDRFYTDCIRIVFTPIASGSFLHRLYQDRFYTDCNRIVFTPIVSGSFLHRLYQDRFYTDCIRIVITLIVLGSFWHRLY